jgi:hypothetical protein
MAKSLPDAETSRQLPVSQQRSMHVVGLGAEACLLLLGHCVLGVCVCVSWGSAVDWGCWCCETVAAEMVAGAPAELCCAGAAACVWLCLEDKHRPVPLCCSVSCLSMSFRLGLCGMVKQGLGALG